MTVAQNRTQTAALLSIAVFFVLSLVWNHQVYREDSPSAPRRPGRPAAATADLYTPAGSRDLGKNQSMLLVQGPPSDRLLAVLSTTPAAFVVTTSDIVDHPLEIRAAVAAHHDIVLTGLTRRGDRSDLPDMRVIEQGNDALAVLTGTRTTLWQPLGASDSAHLDAWTRQAVDLGRAHGLTAVLSTAGRDAFSEAAGQAVTIAGPRVEDATPTRTVVAQLDATAARGIRFVRASTLVDHPTSIDAAWATRVAAAPAFVVPFLWNLTFALFTGVLVVVGVFTSSRILLLLFYARRHHRRTEDRWAGRRYTEPVTVIVPAYCEEAGIRATLESLVLTDYEGHVRVLVVDDGSTDATADEVRAFCAENPRHDISLICKDNGGKADALNVGLAHADTEVVVMIDGDTVFTPTTIRELVQPFVDEKVGAVSGNARVINNHGYLGIAQHIEYVVGFNLDRRFYDLTRCMPTVPGAAGAFRRTLVLAVGGLATDTLAEDTDLTMAINRAGFDVVYAPEAIALTEAPQTWKALWKQRYRWTYGTMQATWKHKSAFLERGKAGHFGRVGITYLLIFQVFLPVLGLFTDLLTVWMVAAGYWKLLALGFLFVVLQMGISAVAFRLDRQPVWPVLWIPLIQFGYRQMMYLVVLHSLWTAATGEHLPWQRMERYGSLRTRPLAAASAA